MIGNDIVDIKKAHSEGSWKQERFVNKIFTNHELVQIASSGDPFSCIWRMWSMKESAYKVIVQNGKERFLNPHKLVCTIKDEILGMVRYEEKSYATRSIVSDKYIYSSHSTADSASIIDEILQVKDRSEQSKLTRLALMQRVAAMFEYPIKKLSITKNKQGVPKLYFKNEPLSLHFSLTHHGIYGAYAIDTSTGNKHYQNREHYF